MTIELVDQRIARLVALRDRIDAELIALDGWRSSQPRRRRSPRVVPPCGTESGYQRHRWYGETCDACRLAHNAHERARARLRRMREAS